MKFINYVKDTRQELNHVSWPTRSQTVAFTIVVIILSIAVGVLLGLFDSLFVFLIETFLV